MSDLQSELLGYFQSANPMWPPYLRTGYCIKAAIANDLLKPGEQLPSIRGLSELLDLNPMTVNKAMNDLNSLGLIVKERGKRYTVISDATSLIKLEIERDVKNHILGNLTQMMKDFNITKTTVNQWLKETNANK